MTDSGDVLGVSVNSVIFEQHSEIGSVYTVPAESSLSLPIQRIDHTHYVVPKSPLLAVLDRFPECFNEKPGLCNLGEHEIIMSVDFTPRRTRAYKVPVSLKEEVDEQFYASIFISGSRLTRCFGFHQSF